MGQPTQDFRAVQVSSVFGKDVLLFRSLMARERLGQCFVFDLEVYSTNASLDFKKVVGTSISICLELPNNSKRYFNGWVSQFTQTPSKLQRYASYRVTLRPWLWFLSRYSDCRFFQDKNVPDILKDVFNDRGLKDFDLSKIKTGDYQKREYCVQYRETDLNFVSRLLEEEGIYYYFEHTPDGQHILTLADSKAAHKIFPDYATIPFTKTFDPHNPKKEAVYDWTISQSVQAGEYALNSFDFEQPANPLYSPVNMAKPHPQANAAMYDYPGPDYYFDMDTGRRYAKIRLEELHVDHEQIHAKTNAMGLTVSKLFSLTEHPRSDNNREYLITGSQIILHTDFYESSSGGDDTVLFSCDFSVLDAKQPFRPRRITPKPVVHGLQTAIVVAEEGEEKEEISTEQHGRVKVQFHWNRPDHNMQGKNQQDRSCWIRVAQFWAGAGWGAQFIPRIGHEVVVDFEEGNPDCPLIVGSVYNGTNKYPYSLPADKTQSGVKTHSSKKGSEKNYNQIRFEDKKNREEINIHAERNLTTIVENDENRHVYHDRSTTIGYEKKPRPDEVIEVLETWGDRDTTIHGNDFLTIKEGSKGRVVTIEDGDDIITVDKGDKVTTVKTGNQTIVVETGDQTTTIKKGNHKLDVKLGKSETEAMQSIELKVGANSIKIDQMGITIKGIMVNIEGMAMAEMKAPLTTVKGDALLTLKGGLVLINS